MERVRIVVRNSKSEGMEWAILVLDEYVPGMILASRLPHASVILVSSSFTLLMLRVRSEGEVGFEVGEDQA